MRKTLAIILAVVLAFALTGCSSDGKDLEEKLNGAFDSIEAGFDSLEEKLEGTESEPDEKVEEPEQAPEETPEEEQEQVPEEAPAEEPQQAPAEDGIRPEIREAIDSYEEFFSEYVDFMKSYDASDISALGDYLSFLEQYTDTMQKLDDMEDADLTDEETIYLTQATLRIDQMLLEVVN